MDDKQRQDAVNAVMEGIIAAHNVVNPMIILDFGAFETYAQAALASLESAGFKVVRDRQ